MSIIIKNVLLNNKIKDIYIEKNIIKEINNKINTEAEFKIDGEDKAAMPSFFNAHTHAAMTLFRGYADDMQLQQWLEKKIWPLEKKLEEKDVYIGSKLACLEMIKSGTTFFNDMYWHWKGTAKAVEELGIRAVISAVFIDLFDQEKAKEQIKENEKLYNDSKDFSERVIFALGPHAIYSVSKESLQWAKEFADKNNLLIHIHLSETKNEVDSCIKEHKKRPVEYLQDIGFLGENLITCHSVWLNKKETNILAKNNVKLVHNPSSNMKLAVGNAFQYEQLKKAGILLSLGTDGCASNNNLDMFEEMKIASLLQKMHYHNPTLMPANEVFKMATINGAKTFRIMAGVEEGKIADLILINLKDVHLVPRHNLISNLVYSANSSCVDTTICDGKILMQNRIVEGEDKIKEEAQETAEDLISRK